MKRRYAWNRVVVEGDTARVTLSTGRIAPGIIRARVAIAGHFDTTGKHISEPRIVAQGPGWMTWEARRLTA